MINIESDRRAEKQNGFLSNRTSEEGRLEPIS